MSNILLDTLILACVGVAFEVVFTALAEFRSSGNWRLMGQSYIWMFPIYALLYPSYLLLHGYFAAWNFLPRGAIYVAILFAVEYLSGWVIKKITGRCPWDYGNARWAVHGLIRLDFAPAWFVAVLGYEYLFLHLRG